MTLWLIVLLLSPGARADGFDRAARARLAGGDVRMAVFEWERAYAAEPDPRYLLEMGRALGARAETCEEAAAAFERFFEACGGCEQAAAGRAAQAEAAGRCTAELRFDPSPAQVDGRPAASPQRLWAGPHAISVDRDGHRYSASWCAVPGIDGQLELGPSSKVAVAVDADPERRAFAHQEAAFAHVAAGRHCAGVREFDQAHAARAEPGFLYNMAIAYSLWRGRCAEAMRTFDRFLADCPGCAEASEARTRREQLRRECAGTLEVLTQPPAARVAVGGQDGTAPLVVRVPPGRYRVVVTAPGHLDLALDAPVDAGRKRTLELTLEPVGAPEPEATAPVAVAPAAPPPEPGRPFAWASWTVGLVGLGTAGFFTWQANEDFDQYESLVRLAAEDPSASQRADILDTVDRLERDRTLALVGWGLGAAGAVAGTVLWFLEGRTEEQAWNLGVAPGGMGVGRAF